MKNVSMQTDSQLVESRKLPTEQKKKAVGVNVFIKQGSMAPIAIKIDQNSKDKPDNIGGDRMVLDKTYYGSCNQDQDRSLWTESLPFKEFPNGNSESIAIEVSIMAMVDPKKDKSFRS